MSNDLSNLICICSPTLSVFVGVTCRCCPGVMKRCCMLCAGLCCEEWPYPTSWCQYVDVSLDGRIPRRSVPSLEEYHIPRGLFIITSEDFILWKFSDKILTLSECGIPRETTSPIVGYNRQRIRQLTVVRYNRWWIHKHISTGCPIWPFSKIQQCTPCAASFYHPRATPTPKYHCFCLSGFSGSKYHIRLEYFG